MYFYFILNPVPNFISQVTLLQNYSSVNKRQATLKKGCIGVYIVIRSFTKAFHEASALMNILGERWYIDRRWLLLHFFPFFWFVYRTSPFSTFMHSITWKLSNAPKSAYEMRMQKSVLHAIFNVSPTDRVGIKNYSTAANK